MNGVHDMGGLQGFGPVRPEPNEPLFHADWEKRAMAITVAMGASGQWNIDLSRSARESLPPAVYLGSSYYEIWIRGLEALLLQRGMVSASELASATMSDPAPAGVGVLKRERVDQVLARGSPASRPAQTEAVFRVGQTVRARNMHPPGHTRLPRYVRGHVGVIERVHGVHLLPDRHASKPLPPFDDTAEWLYTVSFAARDLWGPAADPQARISVDAWESYLEGGSHDSAQ